MEYRRIKKIITGKNAIDGAGVKLVRVFGYHNVVDFDPFLMLDAFDSSNPDDYVLGFPRHPHRGIETITYLIHGEIEHEDSLGNKGIIRDGDCQWMTAGSGIIHQEMPKQSRRLLGAQLWLNLPADAKMTEPGYGYILSSQIPVIQEPGCEVRVIAGNYCGQTGAFHARYVPATYLDVTLKENQEWHFSSHEDETLFFYAFSGDASFHDPRDQNPDHGWIPSRRAVLFEQGKNLYVRSGHEGVRFILLQGPPLKESIAWGGPIVMNTRNELNLAFYELEDGSFIKHKTK